MRIAVPIWKDRLSPVLDTASRLLVIETDDQMETFRFETLLTEQDIHRRCQRLKSLGVDRIICGAVSRPFLRMLTAVGIDIISGISGNSQDVLTAYFDGTLHHARFIMPGFKRNRYGRGKATRQFGKQCMRQRQEGTQR